MMAVVNADSGKVITTLAIGEGVDATTFDEETGLAFASCGEGVLTVVHEDSPEQVQRCGKRDHATGSAHARPGREDA